MRNNIISLVWNLKFIQWKLFHRSCGAWFLLLLDWGKLNCTHLAKGLVEDSLVQIRLLNFHINSFCLKERSISPIRLTNRRVKVFYVAFILIHLQLFCIQGRHCVLHQTFGLIRVFFQSARSLSARNTLWCTYWLFDAHSRLGFLWGSLFWFLINTFIRAVVR